MKNPFEQFKKTEAGVEIQEEAVPTVVVQSLNSMVEKYQNADEEGRWRPGTIRLNDLGDGKKEYVFKGVIAKKTNQDLKTGKQSWLDTTTTVTITVENDEVVNQKMESGKERRF